MSFLDFAWRKSKTNLWGHFYSTHFFYEEDGLEVSFKGVSWQSQQEMVCDSTTHLIVFNFIICKSFRVASFDLTEKGLVFKVSKVKACSVVSIYQKTNTRKTKVRMSLQLFNGNM